MEEECSSATPPPPPHQCWSLAELLDRDAHSLPEVYTHTHYMHITTPSASGISLSLDSAIPKAARRPVPPQNGMKGKEKQEA